MRLGAIKDALAYVHHHEKTNAPTGTRTRIEAAREAITILALDDAERDVLLRVLHVEPQEINA